VSASTFGPDFHQQFGAHLVEESKTAWQGRDQQGPKPPRPRRQPRPQRRNLPTLRSPPSSLRRGPSPVRASWRSSTPLRGCSKSVARTRGFGTRHRSATKDMGSHKAVAAQQEQEARPSSSKAQPPQQQGAAPTQTVAGDVDFNIRQAEQDFALLQEQITSALPQQHTTPPQATLAPAAAAQAAPASQQHVWHTLQAMQAQLDQWR
jgi:hypothetical protein